MLASFASCVRNTDRFAEGANGTYLPCLTAPERGAMCQAKRAN